jgi:hypothetical protein
MKVKNCLAYLSKASIRASKSFVVYNIGDREKNSLGNGDIKEK